MSVKKSFSAAEITDEQGDDDRDQQQQQLHRFDPEAEENEPEDLQEEETVVDKKDEEEVKRDEAEEDEEVEEEEEEEEEDKEDGDEDAEEEEEEEEEEDSKEKSPSGDKSEFMEIDLGEIRKDVQCPICLGIIKKTRTVMECLHRFCRECIDKSMRLGNNECPACRKHCASRRSLRDDPKFDALIAALFTNIDSYEQEEFAFHEDDKARNKQIQASIAEISQRQSEALVKRKSFGKEAAVLMRSQRRRRRNCRNAVDEDDNNNEDNINNNGGGDSSSDERGAEVRLRKRRKRSASRSTPHPSSSGAINNNNNGGNCGDNDTEVYRDKGISPGLVWNPEMLAWGRSATRSNPRHENNTQGGGSSSSSKSLRNARVNKLVEYLRSNVCGNNVEVDIHLKLVSLDAKCVPDIPQPYLRCRATLLVKQLREFVALQTHLKTEEVELLVTRGENKAIETLPVVASASASKGELQSLEDDETLSRLKTDFSSSHEQHLTIAYRQKQTE
ncbi:putative E3 ubiquitin-protein ligase RING1a [Raphanus sativus]|uniref:E3 ubiquitin-protein ligase RING1a isoform X2 n=1 Tax=Raphanus sativus TaxID=3726 RepID=A0A6J0MXB7_RAPSA|nr:putative E3 ubiquitin-protein ligase RING1a isoform X2 [Raphanus sativus]KAJ4901688.1 putative E3 ubiquitin-protein ligase RING1a [Raphanus sativus]